MKPLLLQYCHSFARVSDIAFSPRFQSGKTKYFYIIKEHEVHEVWIAGKFAQFWNSNCNITQFELETIYVKRNLDDEILKTTDGIISAKCLLHSIVSIKQSKSTFL